MKVLGIDVGGSGIKGAVVDTKRGRMLTERYRLTTPQPATPDAVVETVAELVRHFAWDGPVGCGFPAAIRAGRALTAANVDPEFLGFDIRRAFERATGRPFAIANDADAAGLAEMAFGAGQGRGGLVLIVTLGTGIGTALFIDGRLVPNTELGHIELNGVDAEKWASANNRKEEQLDWAAWAARVDSYLRTMNALFWPELIIVGGGVSKKHEKYLPLLTVDTEIVAARMRNEAGIVGAALLSTIARKRSPRDRQPEP